MLPVSVGVSFEVCENFANVDFAVKEPPDYFCQNKEKDGEAVWEDSCVEVFLKTLDRSGCYANFEFNSKGVCYAARGKDRQNRVELAESEYAQIIRKASGVSKDGDFLRWTLAVQVPRELLLTEDDLRTCLLSGNIYKCADLAAKPHWLSLFPIETPAPDFHRPEFFNNILY